MFRRLPDAKDARIRFTFDDRELVGRRDNAVAAALLAAGVAICRTTPVSGAPRGPYCMMGVCFDCRVTIDGAGNRQGCLVPLVQGMRIETQAGAPIAHAEGTLA